MKSNLRYLYYLLPCLGLLTVYLIISFISTDINASNWGVVYRSTFACAGSIAAFIGMVFAKWLNEERTLENEHLQFTDKTEQQDKPAVHAIKLTPQEIKWIKLCKGHYKQYDHLKATTWSEGAKPLFLEIYGWNPDEHPEDYRKCLLSKLLDIYMKIQDDQSNYHAQLKGIINAACRKQHLNSADNPEDRCISELCSLIAFNPVMKDGISRYELTEKESV